MALERGLVLLVNFSCKCVARNLFLLLGLGNLVSRVFFLPGCGVGRKDMTAG